MEHDVSDLIMNVELIPRETQVENCNTLEVLINLDLKGFESSSTFIFNIYDLSYDCNNYESSSLGVFTTLDNLMPLKKSHFLIENNLNEFIVFDEAVLNKESGLEEDCAYRNLNDIAFGKNSNENIVRTSTLVCKKDIIISQNDQKIRLWYYSRSNASDGTSNKIGIDYLLIKSNWIEL
ncbi:hypothetical protein [Aureisphaera sp.]